MSKIRQTTGRAIVPGKNLVNAEPNQKTKTQTPATKPELFPTRSEKGKNPEALADYHALQSQHAERQSGNSSSPLNAYFAGTAGGAPDDVIKVRADDPIGGAGGAPDDVIKVRADDPIGGAGGAPDDVIKVRADDPIGGAGGAPDDVIKVRADDPIG